MGRCSRGGQGAGARASPALEASLSSPSPSAQENSKKHQEEVVTFNRSPGLRPDSQPRVFSGYLETLANTVDGEGEMESPGPSPSSSRQQTPGKAWSEAPGGYAELI